MKYDGLFLAEASDDVGLLLCFLVALLFLSAKSLSATPLLTPNAGRTRCVEGARCTCGGRGLAVRIVP